MHPLFRPRRAAAILLTLLALMALGAASAQALSVTTRWRMELAPGVVPLDGQVRLELRLDAQNHLVCELTSQDLALDLPWLSGRASLRASGRLESDGLALDHFQARIERGTLLVVGGELDAAGLTLSGSGRIPLGQTPEDGAAGPRMIVLQGLTLDWPGVLALRGDVRLPAAADAGPPQGSLSGRLEDAATLAPVLGLADQKLSGAADLRVELGRETKLTLTSQRLALGERAVELSAEITAQDWQPLQPMAFSAVDARLRTRRLAEQDVPAGPGLRLDARLTPVSSASRDLNLRLELTEGASPDTAGATASSEPPAPLLRATGRLTREAGGGFDGVRLDLTAMDGGGSLRLTRGTPNKQGVRAWTGTLALESVPVALPLAVLRAVGFEAPGWELSGTLDLAGTLPAGTSKPRELRATLKGLSGASPDARYLAQDLTGSVSVSHLSGRNFQTKISIDGGEALVSTTYLNFSQAPLSASLQGVPFSAPDGEPGLNKGTATLALGDFLAAGVEGSGTPSTANGSVHLDTALLGPIYTAFLKEYLVLSEPAWGEASMSGQASLRTAFDLKDGRLDLDGRLTLAGVGLSNAPGGLELEGMDLDLPLRYRLGATDQPRSATSLPPLSDDWGSLHVGHVAAGPVVLDNLTQAVALVPNRLFVGGEVAVPLYGGRVLLRNVLVNQPLSPDFEAVLSVVVDALDLSTVPAGPITLSGLVAGRLDQVRLTAKRLTTRGALGGTFFGGLLTMSNIAADKPLASDRAIDADIHVERMNLLEFSTALDVGRITGRLNLSLDNLVLAYGQPVAFKLTAESVPVPGVPETISLKAVDSITQVGTGNALTGMGIDIFASFFKQFPYDQIGLLCELHNDVFRIRGLIESGGVEYIVKRPAFYGINVINSNPDNRISFSDMKERINRVIGATAKDKAPSGAKEETQ